MNYDQLLDKLVEDLPHRSFGSLEIYKFIMPEWYHLSFIFAVSAVIIAVLILWLFPIYAVWASKKKGQAELAEAEFAEQVAIAKAKARKNSAVLHKEAEIIEAQAVANSINTIGDSLTANESYLKWQWIKTMKDSKNTTVYVPTEASLPILEAGKAGQGEQRKEQDS